MGIEKWVVETKLDVIQFISYMNAKMESVRPDTESVTDFITRSDRKQQAIDFNISRILSEL